MAPGEPTSQELLEEARRCQQRSEWVEALDYYEELDRRGSLDPAGLVAMGVCLMQTRQRQDARQIWLRALEINPDFQPAIDELDRNFRGWQRGRSGATHPPAGEVSAAPPPPAPDASASRPPSTLNLTVETIQPPGAAAPPPPPSPPSPASTRASEGLQAETIVSQPHRPAPPVEREEPAPYRPAVAPRPSARGPRAQPRPAAPAAYPAPAATTEPLPPINWDLVMADAMEESGSRH